MRIPSKWNPYLTLALCGFLVLAVAVVFGQTLHHGFINFDDELYVYENPHVARGFSFDSIAWAFSSFHASNWHPVTWLSHLLDCQLYGAQEAGGHHLANVLLHAAVAVLLFLVFQKMTGDLWPSAFVAAVFAIHPLRVESVAWVAERKDLLCGLFFSLTLWAYLGYVRRPFSLARYLLVAALFALGLMAKPMLVTLPLLLLLLDHWPLGRFRGCKPQSVQEAGPLLQHSWWRLVVEKIPLLALAAASCVVTSLAQHTALADLENVTFISRIANALVSYVAYLGMFFYPRGLAVFYPYPLDGFQNWQVACASLLLAGISTAALMQWRRRPYLSVGWFWYLGMLVPVIGVVQVGSQAMADRYTYLPQIGLAVAIAWGAANIAGARPYRLWACAFASACAVAALMFCAWQQTAYWHNSETLWRRALDCTGGNVFAHNNLGIALAGRNHVDEAIDHYKKALKINHCSAYSHINLGNALVSRGQLDDALGEYQQALKFQPDNAKAHYNLGNVLADRGQTSAAIDEYQKALDIAPDCVVAYNNLGAVLAGNGRIDEAVPNFEEALKINPHFADAHNNLGMALEQQGKIAEAMMHWRESVQLNPKDVRILKKLAWTMATHPDASVRNGEEAVELAEWAVRLSGGSDPALFVTLAAAYAEAGRFSEAVKTAERALALATANKDAETAQALQEQIKLYRACSPFHEARSLQ